MTIKNKGYLGALNRLIDKSAVDEDTYALSDVRIEMLMMSEEDINMDVLSLKNSWMKKTGNG